MAAGSHIGKKNTEISRTNTDMAAMTWRYGVQSLPV